jgi:hypothetical protein
VAAAQPQSQPQPPAEHALLLLPRVRASPLQLLRGAARKAARGLLALPTQAQLLLLLLLARIGPR